MRRKNKANSKHVLSVAEWANLSVQRCPKARQQEKSAGEFLPASVAKKN